MEEESSPPSSPGDISARSTEQPTSNRGDRSNMNSPSRDDLPVDMDNLIDDPGDQEEEEGEDLFNDNFMRDYQRLPEQDEYEAEGIDDDVEDNRDLAQVMQDRRAADAAMGGDSDLLYGAVAGTRRKLPEALNDDDADEEPRPRRRPRPEPPSVSEADDHAEEEEEEEDNVDPAAEEHLYMFRGSLREWIAREDVRRFVARKFRHFLHVFKKDTEKPYYVMLVEEMVAANSSSLELDYEQWIHTNPMLAVWLADAPDAMLEIMEEETVKFVMKHHEKYAMLHERIHLRVGKLPIEDQIRNIRQVHLNTLVKISGVVTRRSGVFPQLQQVKYDCTKCGAILGPFFQNYSTEIKVGSCPECQSRGPFQVNVEQTIYRNYQKLTLQESPGTVPAGRLPRYKEIILLDDLIDCARPGEEIEVTGIYTNNFDLALNTKNGFPVFATMIEANHISKKQDLFSAYKLTEEDKADIIALSKDPRIGQRIIKSIAPSIYGHEDIKTGIALAMFGGQEKNVQGKHRLRGDINILLLGDPGTAKSQFLKYVEKTAQRAVYTTGKGASAVGLTAAVHKDPVTREWTLEGGALVLADRGICLIDEFDKMNDQDRVSIHEAMEQQSISISKAGIVTSLQARCSVIAAANPIGGRYDSGKTFAQNVELTDPILSRFDVLRVVKDVVDPVADEMLARFVVESHHKSHPKRVALEENGPNTPVNGDDEILSQDMLRKYVTYAKQNVFPTLHDADFEKIAQVYADLRRESMHGQGVPIAVRHIESMIRMSEAHARMHLRTYVTEDDVDMAIRVLLESFIATQKYGVQKSLQKSFKKYMTYKREFNELVLYLLRGLVKDALRFEELVSRFSTPRLTQVTIKMDELEAKAREYGINDLHVFYSGRQFQESNFTADMEHRIITHPVV
ncbi:hypothetical protein R1flu_007205 [Riccia fluitans]|uniref:DNA replication licensing factor MCM2 n=1 Tax=Riccia fluitans TaxID=41844 RepID=A0ABD1YY81_9MARC